ncbi:type III-A CRISPR-associated RAMP protein Csm5 [Deferrisoma camini]|uniref:type III-A CRISPR-associated RAMP protein Csm5 n=1 Tax=Deferrisoma camini TaxID=1035120 RepID=UPI00046D6251|nr:type III-A CRISPR-associated RAMP protein Csm5 [Deferrisoma camini]
MTTLRYTGRVLTPVHVGTGEAIDPLDYVVVDDRLVRFNASAVLSDLPETERQRFEGILDRGDLKELQAFFRTHVVPERHGVTLVRAGRGVVRRFEDAIGRPLRSQLKVRPMIRNLHTGRAYLPGSSIKGAIRTALVNRFAAEMPGLKEALRNERAGAQKARKLEQEALKYDFRRLERDPLRTLKVSDAHLPPDCTQVDEVFNVKPERQQDMPVDMWERCLSRADNEVVTFKVDIRFDEHLFDHPLARKHLGRRFTWDDLVEACNDFYWGRLLDEDRRFYRNMANGGKLIRPIVFGPFLAAGNGGAKRPVKPAAPKLLLRLGRFTQFESKSVDGLREGWNVRRRQPIREGSTRNLVPVKVMTRNGLREVRIPFGWVLLEPEE